MKRLKREKKWTLRIQKSKIVILVLNQSPISAVFSTVRFPWDPKTALTEDPLYQQMLANTGGPRLVRFLGPQGTALLEKPH